jgi:hypothetical protein
VHGLGIEQHADLRERRATLVYCEPTTLTRPDVGASRPTIMRMVVDLPARSGRGNGDLPGRTVKLTPSTAVLDPYLLVTFSATIMLRRYAGSSVVASTSG